MALANNKRRFNLFGHLLSALFLAYAAIILGQYIGRVFSSADPNDPVFPGIPLLIFSAAAYLFHLIGVVLLEGWSGYVHRLKIGWHDFGYLLPKPGLWPLFLLPLFPPYFLSQLGRRFLRLSGSDRPDYLYGETPYFTFDRLLRSAEVTRQDVIYDLGSGSGRLVFYLSLSGYKAVGLELNPWLARAAERWRRLFRLRNGSVIQGDISQIDLRPGTVFYLAATAFSEELLSQVSRRLADLPAGIKIICLTHPLTDPRFILGHQEALPFSWASEEAYFYRVS